MGVHTREQKVYLQIISDGSIRKQVPEGTPGSVRREYEDKDTKETKVKFEMVYNAIDGLIGDITVMKGKFGDQIIVPIKDGDDVLTLALSTSSNFGEDFMKKLPNINLSKPVLLTPFSFDSDKGKLIRGVDVRQDFDLDQLNSGNKIPSNYYDPVAKKNINGFPSPDGDTRNFSTDDWKVYFITARKFLIGDLRAKGIIKDAATAAESKPLEVSDEVPESDGEEVPF